MCASRLPSSQVRPQGPSAATPPTQHPHNHYRSTAAQRCVCLPPLVDRSFVRPRYARSTVVYLDNITRVSRMEPVVSGRKRPRDAAIPLRCHVVDDHCDALRHIHAAVRRGALPFSGIRMMHWDAHPDLMVTPDMPADICFCPNDLYDTLDTAEGGIAEWILPLVYQGHLSKLWWIRPPWARQFVDGDYRFSVGQVAATGRLRVSSTAPYFVDDRLHCPEADMQRCKPLHLCVSLAPEAHTVDNPTTAGDRTPDNVAPRVERAETESMPRSSAGISTKNGDARPVGGMVGGVTGGSTNEVSAAISSAESEHDSGSTPWVLDICLDYFTTENPFMTELESLIGKEDAALVRAFYERPRFRGADTALPHDLQVEHERTFKSEVDRLLRVSTREIGAGSTAVSTEMRGAMVDSSTSSLGGSVAETLGGPGTTSPTGNKADSSPMVTDATVTVEGDIIDETVGKVGGLQRLTELFAPDGEDSLLASRFVSMVGRMGPIEREVVAWTDHCACLPRYSATQDEVRASVRTAERLLRLRMGTTGSSDWSGRPGVITVARSERDGYVPSDMVTFVEGEVLAMLKRLFDDGHERAQEGSGMEVVYEEGLAPAKD